MKDNPINLLLDKHKELNSRDEKLRQREEKLAEIIVEQNQRFDKLRKGYVLLGYVDKIENTPPRIITRNDFYIILKELTDKLNKIGFIPESIHKSYEVIDGVEKIIADIFALITDRWNSISVYKELWRKERIELRENEIKLINEYSKLSRNIGKQNNQELEMNADKIVFEHKQLIEAQGKKLSNEEELVNELERLFNDREKFFKMAIMLLNS